MFEFLQGRVEAVGPGGVVLAAGGIGWLLQVPSRAASRLRPGERARLLVHLAVSEQNLALFGFLEEAERTLFRRLLQVSGIGPACALSLLGTLAPQDLATAILDGDVGRLCSARGVGRRTAERLIVELRDRLAADGLVAAGAGRPRPDELERVLAELGFRPREASERATAARRVVGSEGDFQELLRAALQMEAAAS